MTKTIDGMIENALIRNGALPETNKRKADREASDAREAKRRELRAAAVRYVTNCYDCNPDAPTLTRAREFYEDEGEEVPPTWELEQIAIEALEAFRSPKPAPAKPRQLQQQSLL